MAASQSQARPAPRGGGTEWFAQHPAWLLALATILVLLPFIGKPFNIDDPLFVWVAKQIPVHPASPYGFNANWYGYEMPLWQITKNPPLACYYLALIGSIFGWSEIALHASLLLPAVAVVLGTYRLAVYFCKRPLLASFLTLFTPVFLVSSTTVMCDVLMLAFWVWAIVFWIEGVERKRPAFFAAAALLMTLAVLTKYFGACIIPLVAVWSAVRTRSVKGWLGWLAFPVFALIAYQFATRALYGHGLFADAGKYAVAADRSPLLLNQSLLAALAFTGGCLAVMTFFTPLLWSRRQLLSGGFVSLAFTIILFALVQGTFAVKAGGTELVQILLWSSGGIALLALAIADVCRHRNADAVLLLCWVVGTFVFTAFFNWIVNGRSILPLAIPAAILVARRLEQRTNAGVKISQTALAMPIAIGALLAIFVTAADYSFAVAPQVAAQSIHSAYSDANHRLWFQGHWGFQYYMEKEGAKALDLQHLQMTEGDRIAMPSDNSNVYAMKEPMAELETFEVPTLSWLTTMNKEAGAGFYASLWGPLPFAFGTIPPQTVTILAYDPTGEIQKTNSLKAP